MITLQTGKRIEICIRCLLNTEVRISSDEIEIEEKFEHEGFADPDALDAIGDFANDVRLQFMEPNYRDPGKF